MSVAASFRRYVAQEEEKEDNNVRYLLSKKKKKELNTPSHPVDSTKKISRLGLSEPLIEPKQAACFFTFQNKMLRSIPFNLSPYFHASFYPKQFIQVLQFKEYMKFKKGNYINTLNGAYPKTKVLVFP